MFLINSPLLLATRRLKPPVEHGPETAEEPDTWTTVNTLMDTFCIPMALMTTTGPLFRYSPPHPYVMVNQIYEDDVRCVPSTLNPKPFPHSIIVNPRIPISSSSSEAIFFSIDFLSGCSPSSGSCSSIAWLFFPLYHDKRVLARDYSASPLVQHVQQFLEEEPNISSSCLLLLLLYPAEVANKSSIQVFPYHGVLLGSITTLEIR